MTIDAHHLNLFSSQLISNRDMIMNATDTNFVNIYNNYPSLLPLSGTTTVSENFISSQPPPYNPFIAHNFHHKIAALKSDSYLTYNNNNVLSFQRKRYRDTTNNYSFVSYKNQRNLPSVSKELSQNSDIDHIISQHMEKVRVELEEKRKREARMLMEAIELEMMKRLKTKEKEVEKMERMNMLLEEKVKSLIMENQIWRELAQTNEATANALRNNLEQVLTQMTNNCEHAADAAAANDVESCCGNNNDEEIGWRTVAECAQDKVECEGNSFCNENTKRLCKNCGKGESCVLILPCRHLCVCTICGVNVHNCPVCNSFKNATLHVNL